jgi:GNAT superfamily N-acetyltransferase
MSDSDEKIVIRRMETEDIPRVQEIGQMAWSDIATREIGRKVRYPLRPRRIIEAYMWKDPRGCLVVEKGGTVVGSAYAHVWGKLGWLGPFEVLPKNQDQGLGKALLRESESYLEGEGCDVMSLETMCSVAKNIHFYMKAGYRTIGASIIMEKVVRFDPGRVRPLQPAPLEEVREAIPELVTLSARVNARLDYSREAEMAPLHGLGPVFLWRSRKRIKGVAVLHSIFPPEDSDHASLRLLIVDPKVNCQNEGFEALMRACENWAYEKGRRRVFVRFPADNSPLYREMASIGYRIGGANLRMCKGPSHVEKGRYHLAAWAG